MSIMFNEICIYIFTYIQTTLKIHERLLGWISGIFISDNYFGSSLSRVYIYIYIFSRDYMNRLVDTSYEQTTFGFIVSLTLSLLYIISVCVKYVFNNLINSE